MSGNLVISSSKVQGTAVYNGNGEKLGSIDDLKIDKRSGLVRYAVLEFGGFLGIGTDRYPIPWKLLTYDVNLEGYVVPIALPQLENAPHYGEDQAPEYTDDYGRRIDGHYSLALA